jgi:hypothetical protein
MRPSVRTWILVALLAGLALPGQAYGKGEISRLAVCGASSCRMVTEPVVLLPITTLHLDLERGAAPAPAGFYTLIPQESETWSSTWPRFVYVPSADAVLKKWYGEKGGEKGVWYSPTWSCWALRKATRGLEPRSKPASWNSPRVMVWKAERRETSSRFAFGRVLTLLAGIAGAALVTRSAFRRGLRVRRRGARSK